MAPFSSLCVPLIQSEPPPPLLCLLLLFICFFTAALEHSTRRAEAVLWRFPAAASAPLLIVIAVALNSAYTLLYFSFASVYRVKLRDSWWALFLPRTGARIFAAIAQSDSVALSVSGLFPLPFFTSSLDLQTFYPRCLNKFICLREKFLMGKCDI